MPGPSSEPDLDSHATKGSNSCSSLKDVEIARWALLFYKFLQLAQFAHVPEKATKIWNPRNCVWGARSSLVSSAI